MMLIRDTDKQPAKPITIGLSSMNDDHMRLQVNGITVFDIFETDDGKVIFTARADIHKINNLVETDDGRLVVRGNAALVTKAAPVQQSERRTEQVAQCRQILADRISVSHLSDTEIYDLAIRIARVMKLDE